MGDNKPRQYINQDYNFAPATGDETLVYGAARPGAKLQRCGYQPEFGWWMPTEDVSKWVRVMKEAGVQRVVSMLTRAELRTYQTSAEFEEMLKSGFDEDLLRKNPLQPAMQAAFGEGKYVNIDPGAPGGPAEILSALRDAKQANEKVVVHSWGGRGRTGLAQAAWLMTDRGMTAEDAATAVIDYANSHGILRFVTLDALKDFVAGGGAFLNYALYFHRLGMVCRGPCKHTDRATSKILPNFE